jgi:NADH-quinone oxidoreductase subunit M
MYKRVIFGEVRNEGVAKLEDLNSREVVVLGVLAAAVLLLGLWPAPLIEVMEPSVNHLLEQIARSRL